MAFGANTLDPNPTWTRIDNHPDGRVVSWTVDRGRQFELDRTDAGRATVQINDPHGFLDPTNPTGPFYGQIEVLTQAVICRKNPMPGTNPTWEPRFRGWVSDWNYLFDPSQLVNRLTLELVDIFEILDQVEMQPGAFGDLPPPGSDAQIWFAAAPMNSRCIQVLQNALIPVEMYVVFSGNVVLRGWPYSVAETPLTVIQEAVDGEFPGVGNAYVDRFGRLAIHGRQAKFDPEGTVASTTPDLWDWNHFKAGDGAAVNADPGGTAHLRAFGFNRGAPKLINHASATPADIADSNVAGQLVQNLTSIGKFGFRSWSRSELLTLESQVDGANALVETKRMAQYYVDNFAFPQNRAMDVSFRSMRPGTVGSQITWRLLSRIDIADQVDITISSPGGGGFSGRAFYVEGIHETCEPLNPEHDNDTVTLDLSPRAYFDFNPFLTPPP